MILLLHSNRFYISRSHPRPPHFATPPYTQNTPQAFFVSCERNARARRSASEACSHCRGGAAAIRHSTTGAHGPSPGLSAERPLLQRLLSRLIWAGPFQQQPPWLCSANTYTLGGPVDRKPLCHQMNHPINPLNQIIHYWLSKINVYLISLVWLMSYLTGIIWLIWHLTLISPQGINYLTSRLPPVQ